jgi:type IV secretory pathway TrbD component
MSSLDLFFVFRSGFTILLGVIAIVVGFVRGSWETVGLGVVALVVGCGLLALQIWQSRHPVRPAPMKLFRKRGART